MHSGAPGRRRLGFSGVKHCGRGPGTQLLRVDRHLARTRLIWAMWPVLGRSRPRFNIIGQFLREFDQCSASSVDSEASSAIVRKLRLILERIRPMFGELGRFSRVRDDDQSSAIFRDSGAISTDAQLTRPILRRFHRYSPSLAEVGASFTHTCASSEHVVIVEASSLRVFAAGVGGATR